MLDIRNPEDLFFCIDALTRARFQIGDDDPHLSEELEEIISSLLFLAENPPEDPVPAPQQNAVSQPPAQQQPPPQQEFRQSIPQDPNDLMAHLEVPATAQPPQMDDDDDQIVDLLTGEVVTGNEDDT